MNRDSNIDIKLANYLYNDMDPEEIIEFEEEMSENPELLESFRMNTKVKEYLEAKVQLEEMKADPSFEEAERLADLAFTDQTAEPEIQRKSHTVSGTSRRRYIFLSAVAATIALVVLIRILNPFANTDRLYQAYYTPMDAPDFNQRGEHNDLYQYISDGIVSYNQGDYEKSVLVFNQLNDRGVHHPEVQLFRGLSNIGLEQYAVAREILQQYIESNSRYIPEATWYLGLCCLKTGDIEMARLLFDNLDAYEGLYKEDAQLLVRKLRRVK
jgi:tetratricopeptide (TPR) repeat protein